MIQASAVQHGMWLAAARVAPAAYHMPLVVTFARDPDTGLLAKSCAAVAERHGLLSSAIVERDGITYVVPATFPAALRVAGPDESVEEEIARPFNLAEGPLIRFALFGRTLVVTAHHLVFDGQSKEVLLRDLAALYSGAVPEPLPTTAADDLAADAARLAERRAAAEEFWTGRWSEPQPLVVAGLELTGRDHGPGHAYRFTPPVPDLPGLTRFETLLAAVHATLAAYGNPRVTTGVDLSTRERGPAGIIGPYATEFPVDSEPGAAFTELRTKLREMYPHRAVPLARAVRRIRPHAALAPVSVSYRRLGETPHFDGAPAEVDWLAFAGGVRGDLQLQAVDDGTTVTASLRYSPAAAPVAERLARDLCALLTRTAVLAIWRDVFGNPQIGPDDDLFDLGGDSLTATQIIARMRKTLGLDVDIDTFFDHPTVNGVVHATDAD
ncbi:condensation domain-containing protein [Dactylosporangium sp. CS-047395]|uniref:condensation domain-containing protein n=1 Tax=Dactylosporangium sp. CS-047395 TaxID=3239936 RepID=UPI003D8C829C